jgi:hypothetical protein
MTETDLQLGGGYTFQWECAILLALNYFFEPLRYNPVLFDLIDSFLGRVDEIHLEGADRESGVDLEDINLITEDRRILIQVKTKQAEGERWTLSDTLLLKALYKFYDSRFLADQPEETRFVFLTNRPFNPDLVDVKSAVARGELAPCAAADRLGQYLDRYARGTSEGPLDLNRFRAMLGRTRFVEYLAVDEIKANIQAKLQAHGRDDWKGAHAVLFEHFARQSTHLGGATVTRASVIELLGPPAKPSAPSQPPVTYRVDTSGGAYIDGDVHVYGGDFVGRDQTKVETPRPAPAARPAVPTEGEPLALIASALEARRLLLAWADVPFPPEERLSAPAALLIHRWQQDAQALPPFPWPVHQLPSATILSLDPSDRIEATFREADVPLNVLCTQKDVVHPGQHNLIKLGGDLKSRSGLLLTRADVRDAPNDPDQVHLLKEARRVARDGVLVVFAHQPSHEFWQLWDELIEAHVGETKHRFALGPADARWPKGVAHLSADVNELLTRLTEVQLSP